MAETPDAVNSSGSLPPIDRDYPAVNRTNEPKPRGWGFLSGVIGVTPELLARQEALYAKKKIKKKNKKKT
jgi:hypothetical protein